MAYLEIKQLTKQYGTRRVVSDIDLQMDEGEILSLLGPSGCGKTTILRMLAGLIKPDSGSIAVGGRVFFDGSRELPVEERQIGMVFQDFALWPHMTVGNNIAFGLRLRREASATVRSRVSELLEMVNLPGYAHRYPYQLSGGQQQRVAVARALATSPRLVLLDEPLSSLDTGLRATMRDELVDLFRRLKITAINVTHDQDEAMMMSDRIMVLHEGNIQQIGTPPDLYQNPKTVFVARFMGAANLLIGSTTGQVDPGKIKIGGSETLQESTLSGILMPYSRERLNGKAQLMCRPDDVRIYATLPANKPNVVSGKVQHSSFVAGRWRTLVNVTGQDEPVLTYPNFALHAGQSVWLEFPPELSHILPN